jgi:hypothetical protein
LRASFLNERDVQLEHIEPPRHPQDWARLHARNIRVLCGSCKRTKGRDPFAEWLDDQEGARLSNLHHVLVGRSLVTGSATVVVRPASLDLPALAGGVTEVVPRATRRPVRSPPRADRKPRGGAACAGVDLAPAAVGD